MPISDEGPFAPKINALGLVRQNWSSAVDRRVANYESEVANCDHSSFGVATSKRPFSHSRHRRNNFSVFRPVGQSLVVGLCQTRIAPGECCVESPAPDDVDEGSPNERGNR